MSDRRLGRMSVLLTCEHGGNAVPVRYQRLFQTAEARRALESHRGWDPGSLLIGQQFKKLLHAPLIASQISRLLIELNRSLGHPRLFSEWTGRLPVIDQQTLIDRYYLPYRERVANAILAAHAAGQNVLHLSLHTFTPIWNGKLRSTDIGLLFDPHRVREAELCTQWQRRLQRALPHLKVHRNRPYSGTSDGLTTALRRQFAARRYLGIELEVNQRFFSDPAVAPIEVIPQIATSLQELLAE